MIERLLAADAALGAGDLDAAERLYDQITTADPHNAIALVGLARVARRRGGDEAARELAERALAIDPEEAAASRLLAELTAAPAATPAAAAAATPSRRPSLFVRLGAWLRSLLGRGA
jgi:tetratricopeptide (TPR) repeat protein